jgi:hypothetical protein
MGSPDGSWPASTSPGRGQALSRRTAFLAQAGDLETKAQARRVQAEGKLQAAQAQARQNRVRPARN